MSNFVTCDDKEKQLTTIKFLLRRIENDIDIEEANIAIINMVKDKLIDFELIEHIINKDIIKKGKVFNSLAVQCYEEKLHDEVIPLLNKAMNIEKDNDNYIFNMGFVLFNFGEKELAMEYLNKIRNRDYNVLSLIASIRQGG